MNNKKERRESLQIIREILDLGGTSRTQIRLSLDLKSVQLDYYMGRLVERGLLEEEPAPVGYRFRVTGKGETLLALLDDLVKILPSPSLQ